MKKLTLYLFCVLIYSCSGEIADANLAPSTSADSEPKFREATREELALLEKLGIWSDSGSRYNCAWSDGQYGSIDCPELHDCKVIFYTANESGPQACLGCQIGPGDYNNVGACRPVSASGGN